MEHAMNRLRNWAAVAAVGLLLMGTASPALAQSRPPPSASARAPVSGKVGIEVMVVHATNQTTGADSRLSSVAGYLKHLKYRGFKLLSQQSSTLSVGQNHTFRVAGGRSIQVDLLSRDDQAAKLRVRMFKGSGKLLETTVSVRRNKSFMVAGPKYEDGVLVLPLTARY